MAGNEINLTIKVTDKGNLKIVGQNAEKAAAGLDKAGKSARTADRNLKGAAQASANSTKNFSKMAQGISGGLVPAYATLAAQVFAITAAFNFLKTAADFEVLATGQAAYARATGVAIKTLTEDIVAATNAQISFADAAQAAAIGSAAGLSTDQLTRLGTAARDASAILGRDVTDSFNRLVRGVTKAEPELLDELGIILRLENASQKYADAIGKDVKNLTQFEKSQAVANDVLEQAEQKYSAVLTEQEKLGNSVAKLGVAFENNLLKPFKEGLAKVLGPVFDFFTENVGSLAVALGLLAVPILKAIIPGLSDMGEAAKVAADEAKKASNAATRAYAKQIVQVKKLAKAQQDVRSQAAAAARETVENLNARKGSGLEILQSGGTPSERQAKGMLRAVEANQGEYKRLNAAQRADLAKNLKLMVADNARSSKLMLLNWQTFGAGTKLVWTGMKAGYASAIASMKAMTTGFVTFANRAMAAIGWIGIFLLLIDLIKIAITKIKEFFETAEQRSIRLMEQAEIDKAEALQSRLKGINEEIAEMTKNTMKGGAAGAEFAGNVLANVDVVSLKTALLSPNEELRAEAYKTAQYYFEIFKNSEEALGETGTKLASIAGKIGMGSADGKFRTEEFVEQFLQYISAAQEAGQAAAKFNSALKNQLELQSQFMGSLVQTSKFDPMIEALDATIKASEDVLRMEDSEIKKLKESIALRDVLVNMREREFIATREKTKLEQKYAASLAQATPLQAERLKQEQQIESIQLSINDKLREKQNLEALIQEQGKEATPTQQNTLILLQDEIDTLGQKSDILQEQLTLLSQMEVAAKGAFEGGVTRGLTDLITGKESSFKQAIANITKATLESIAQSIAKNLSEKISTAIFGDAASNRVKTAHVEGAEVVRQAIIDGHKQGLSTESAVTSSNISSKSIDDMINDIAKGGSSSEATGDKKAGSILDYFFKPGAGKTTVSGEGMSAERGASGGIFGNFVDSLERLFSGEAPFLKGLGDVFMGALGGFDQMFGDILNGIMGLFGGGGGAGGGLFGTIAGLFFANGGIAKGGFRSAAYASGGIAKSPTIGLVGEGKYNEAIVPLPDGKSIPVSMGRGMGQQNNVTVNVSIDGNGAASQNMNGDSQGMDLGRVIAGAVQQELLNQKRQGGILNPNGVA